MPRISLYDVAPEHDEDFLATWEAEGDGDLLRAVRDDADPRYVSIGPDGDHELVHEEGDVDAPGGVILLAWSATAPDAFAGHRGYLGMRVYSGPGEVTVARWSSPLMIQRAGVSYAALYQRVTR